MKMIRTLLAVCILLLVLPQAEAQRGGRSSGKKRPSSSSSRTKSSNSSSDFVSRLWYGAGGTIWFAGGQNTSQFRLGLTPQVGYKFNDWFSAGPRIGATYTGIKGTTVLGTRDRVNLWEFNASGFARARIAQFYIQPEYGIVSQNFYLADRGLIVLDDDNEPSLGRSNEQLLLIGAGYNASVGGMSTDFGVFYNVFDDVNANTSPITVRIMLTFGY